MGGGGKKKKSHKMVESDEEDSDYDIDIPKKKMPSKKGKKGKGRKFNPQDVEMNDDVTIEMDEVESKMTSKMGKKKLKKKKKRMEVQEIEEGEEDMGKMKFPHKKRMIDTTEDNLQDTEMKDVTIDIDQIVPPSEIAVEDPSLSPTKEEVSIEIPDSPRGEVEVSPLKTADASLVLELPEEDKVIPEESDLIKDHMDDTPNMPGSSQEHTTANVTIDIPGSPTGEVADSPLETHDAAIVVELPEEDNVMLEESDFIKDNVDASPDRPGSAEENKVKAVAIDIPESPGGEVVESPLETHDAAVAVEHPEEDNVIPEESDFVKDMGAIPDRPGLAEENIKAASPSVSEGNIEDRPSSGEREVSMDTSIDMETKVPTERVDQLVDGKPESENTALIQEMNTVNSSIISKKETVHDRPASADSIGSQKDVNPSELPPVGTTQEYLGDEEDESDIQLGKDDSISQSVIIDQVTDVVDRPIPSAKTIDQPSEPLVPVDDDIEVDTKTKQSSTDQVLSMEKPNDDMPPPRRNYEPNKNEGKGMDDQDFDLPEDNDPMLEHTKAEEMKSEKTDLPLIENDDELPWAMYRKNREDEHENSIPDEIPEISGSDDEAYAPGLNEDLPDPYEAMNSLDTDDIELNQKTTPHSILDSSQQNVYNKQVHNLKQGIAEEEIKVYLDEFEEHVKQEILMIGNISLGEVQEEERRLREEHILFQQQQAKIQRTRQQEILQAMEKAKKHVMAKHKEKFRDIRMREQHLMQRDRSYKDEIHTEFRRSESQLRKALKRRKAEVKTMYGDLTFADGQYGGSKGRRWKIDWNRAPQPIQIRLKCLRGVKDKLPDSRYVLMVSLYNRLGGNVMKWSSLRGQQWGGATLPMFHNGEFFNIELKIDQSVFTVCPSRPDIRPGMILVFELFILRGPVTPTDKVVGWGCFPICDAEFKVIEGNYKTPMLRGDLDTGIDKFEIIEKLMANDLENWLCNVYFEIIRLPRYMAGQKEYEVELQFTSGLLGAPNRTKTGEENIDGEKAIFGSRSDVNSSMSHHDNKSLRSESIVSSINLDGGSDKSIEKPNLNSLTVDIADGRRSKLSLSPANLQMYRAENLSVDLRRQKVEPMKDEMARPMTSVDASRKLVEERGLQLSDYDSEDSDYRDDDVYALKQDMGFKPVKGEPGMFYKIHYNTPAEVYARKVYTMMPKTPVLSQQKVKKKMTHMDTLNTHSYAVKTPWSNKGHIEHKGTKKIQYMGRMLFSELGISQIKSRTFWAMLLMIIINFWIRLYLHYIGQWVALYAFLIPINSFNFLPYTVELNYQNTLLRTREEIALIVIGPFTCIILFLVMVLVSAFIQLLFERFPNMFSQFIMAFGIHCALDPIWILIVDSALLRFRNRGGDYPVGDAFKMYWHFNNFFHNDNVTLFISIALTSFLYSITIFCAIAILYMYFLRIHNNGRLIDVYWRLHGKEEQFFIPYDLEISNEELSYICIKAEQWRGEEGERRKTAVYDYIWEEEEMADDNWENPNISGGKKTGAKETTTHVSIHTLHLDGLRELYRHFLKLPDGAIVEVFGEMNIPGIDEGVKQALIKRTTFQTITASDGVRKRSVLSQSSTDSIRKRDNNVKVSIVDHLGVPAEVSLA